MSEFYNQRPYVGPILKKPRLSPRSSHLLPGNQIDKFLKGHQEEEWFRNKLQPLVNTTATTANTNSTTSSAASSASATGLHINSSLFKDPSTILDSLSDDVTSMIKNEVRRAHNHHNTNNGSEPPVLTVRQTQVICEKLIREREQRLREEYDKVLINKLAEQYDTFVKYTHDHIEKRYNESNSHQSSYLS